ncbi:hypothetical protein OH76DRAFT_1168959 [Lentinus brumalis]|uniref:MYND-type domain-containing protein n=1 Tax=Lentinus brumalis TaxID=2498619 RepID=A0A371DN45_9APHY|nr:hypothetical protein OH76DRAFT_1168959 [Polyporus brumalis]
MVEASHEWHRRLRTRACLTTTTTTARMPKGRKGRSATASLCALPSCSAPALEQVCCSQCQRARYCKRAHQIADVGRHKAVCVASSSGASAKTRTVDAIFFPANESSPRIVKVNCRVHRDGPAGNPEKHELDWSSYLSSDHEFVPHPIAPVERESSRHTHSSRLFLVFDHSAVFNANMPVNRCAMQLTGGKSAMLWRGDLLGYRVREPSEDHAQFMDCLRCRPVDTGGLPTPRTPKIWLLYSRI